jgi:hypothetical protein
VSRGLGELPVIELETGNANQSYGKLAEGNLVGRLRLTTVVTIT